MVQHCLSSLCEGSLRPTQCGFRALHGTKHSLFFLRRALEWNTTHNQNTHLLILDWKHARDSIDHSAFLSALRRFGSMPENLLKLISTFDDYISFTIKGFLDHAAEGEGDGGIRQGCSLNPCPSIIVLSAISAYVDEQLIKHRAPTNTSLVAKAVLYL